jgi:hypothetical protein
VFATGADGDDSEMVLLSFKLMLVYPTEAGDGLEVTIDDVVDVVTELELDEGVDDKI